MTCDILTNIIVCINVIFIHLGAKQAMRTNIVIDDELIAKAIQVSGLKSKKDVVEQALKLLLQRSEQQALRELRGTLKWEGNLDEMRRRISPIQTHRLQKQPIILVPLDLTTAYSCSPRQYFLVAFRLGIIVFRKISSVVSTYGTK